MWDGGVRGMVAIMTDRPSPTPSSPSGPPDPSKPAAGALTTAPPHRPLRQLLAASVGNAVEWYDWFSYTGTRAAYAQALDQQPSRPDHVLA